MKLLITGGGGFIGARLARALLARGTLGGRSDRAPRADRHRAAARRPARRRARRGPHRPAARRSARRCATKPSTASSTSPRPSRANARPTSTSACAPTSTARAPCSTRCAPRQRGRQGAARRVLELGRGVRPRSGGAAARRRRRRHAAGAADLVRHAQADLRAPDRRLHAQGLHRRPRRAPDDGDGAARAAERRGVVVLQRHHPRAARRRRVDLPGVARRVASDVVAGAHGRGPDRRLRSEPRQPSAAASRSTCRRSTCASREMLDALEEVAGPAVRERVRFERDERIAGIVANWPSGATAARAARLGLQPHDELRRHHPPVHRRLRGAAERQTRP